MDAALPPGDGVGRGGSIPAGGAVAAALACLHFLERLLASPAPSGRKTLAVSALLLAIGLGWWSSLSGGGGNAFIYFQF